MFKPHEKKNTWVRSSKHRHSEPAKLYRGLITVSNNSSFILMYTAAKIPEMFCE